MNRILAASLFILITFAIQAESESSRIAPSQTAQEPGTLPSLLPPAARSRAEERDPRIASRLFSQEDLTKARQRLSIRQAAGDLFFAVRFNQRYRLPQAYAFLEKSARESPEYYYFKGLFDYQSGQKGRALLSLRKAVEKSASYDPALNLMGLILSEADRWQEAVDLFKKAVAASPYDPIYTYNLAYCFFRLNQKEDSMLWTEKTIELRPNFSEAFYLRALLFRESNVAESFRSYENAQRYGMRTGQFLLDFLRTAEAARNEDKILEIGDLLASDGSLDSLRAQASIRLKFGEFDRARPVLERLAGAAEATIADRKLLLFCVFRMREDPFRRLAGLTVRDEERTELQQYSQTLMRQQSLPVRDPVINPGL